MKISESKEWKQLTSHLLEDIQGIKVGELNDLKSRFEDFSYEFDDLLIDFSKQKVTSKTRELLLSLAEAANLKSSIAALSEGKPINTTENRPALHTACRLPASVELVVDQIDINLAVQEEISKIDKMVEKLSNGHWRGYSGKPIRDIVNLGVGGSDLGPLLVCEALDEFKVDYPNNIRVHFASTMDGSQISDIFNTLNPETTVFVLVSKSFSTIDTLSNAASAKAWLMSNCPNEALVDKQHFIGVSVSAEKMGEWGIHPDNQLRLWDWVGGRYSLWSSVGLTIAIKLGMENFKLLLSGAHSIDKHFFETELSQNLPVLMGLIGVWNSNFLGVPAQAILPYDARLKYLPNYLMQLEMESNGKSVTQGGESIDYDSCPVLWGEVGPNAQHAFYQMMHQGTRKVTSDFIAPIRRFSKEDSEHGKSLQEQHLLTLANCFAQSRALMTGGSLDELASNSSEKKQFPNPHKFYPGDQTSTTILIPELNPYTLGQLIALYEHKVFVMATIWGINPFDQWGVELGKIMANETLSELKNAASTEKFDNGTNTLINLVKEGIGKNGKGSNS
ncbi:glucose-6-phosphate isomerase [Aliikangiella marina]|uniref:Glucose-6-phosphate isomerase n=1 Tax=Aliikangiella marina TaxID=1712262 RepID=A0A545TII3_9GAMM|nr:glucose-6-phosphate isomerase [Aliikangiella marina]TQV77039.1 glucose-6-phosphate isomerase [Aliikangiella marina]